jgi:hypothetical protein
MLEPSVVLNIAKAIAEKNDSYEQTIAAVREAFNAIESAESAGSMALNTSEKNWFHRLKKDIEIMPETHEQAVQYLCDSYGDHFLLESYGL